MNPTPYFVPGIVKTSTEHPTTRPWCQCCEPNHTEPLTGLVADTCTWCTDHCGPTCTRANNNAIPRLWISTLNGSRFISQSGEWKDE